jgi:hypothetical protein
MSPRATDLPTALPCGDLESAEAPRRFGRAVAPVSRTLLAFAVASLCWLGCSAGTPASSTADRDEAVRSEAALVVEASLLGCPPRAEPIEPVDRAQIFAEMVVLEAPTSLARTASASSLVELAQRPEVRLLGTPHIMIDAGTRSSMTVATQSGALERLELYQISVGAELAEPDFAVLELELVVQLPHREVTTPPRTSRTVLTVAPRDGRVVVDSAALSHDRNRSLVVAVTPWRIRSEADLRAHFECKMRKHAAKLRQPVR